MKVKKLLSLVLALVMVLTMIPAQLVLTNADVAKTNTGDATDYSLDVSVADNTAGKYKDCIDIKFNVTVDYSSLTDNEKKVTMVSQMLTLDSSLVGTVSKASKTRGNLNMDAVKTLVDNSEDGFITGGADWAVVAEKIPNYDGADPTEADDFTTFDFSSSSLTYKDDGKVYVMLNGSTNNGYYYDEDVTSFTFTVCHLYLRTIGEVTLPQAKAGITLTTDEARIAAGIPSVFTDASYVASKADDPGQVNSVAMSFSSDFDTPSVTYTVAFKNEDGSDFAASQTVNEGASITLPTIPAKDADNTYTYAVDGWYDGETKLTSNTVTITGNKTFVAKYTPTYINYTVKFVDEDSTNLVPAQENLHWGDAVTVPENPSKTNYTFDGWYIGENKVTPSATCDGNKTYVAKFTENGKFTISFKYEDGTDVVAAQSLYEGETVTIPTATKANTAEYTYSFDGWYVGENKVTPSATAQASVTYIAKFNATKNKYTITWQMDDGTTIDTTEVEYGVVPTHTDPTKPATVDESYTFNAWDPAPVAVTGTATYKATFTATPIGADYTAVDAAIAAANDIMGTSDYAAKYTADARNALSNAINEVVRGYAKSQQDAVDQMAAAIVQAKEALELNLQTYSVVFYNDDNSEIETKQVAYGQTPTVDDPTKPATAEYSYSFAAWTPALTAVSYDATSGEMVGLSYKASYNSTKNKYTITWQNEDGTTIETTQVEYGTVPTHDGPTKASDGVNTYTFAGWDPAPVAVTGEATYKATFTATPIPPETTYTVIFQKEDGTEIQRFEGKKIGDAITAPDAPEKTATAQYTFSFSAWKTADGTQTFNGTVEGDITYKPVYTETLRSYTITWQNEDGTTFDTTTVAYGTVPTHDGPTKAEDVENTYTFKAWDPAPVAVTGEATYKATFTANKKSYTITFVDGNGATIQSSAWEYGTTPAYTGASNPTKAATAQYSYTWTGAWDKAIVPVNGEATYTATFNSTVNKYTITWKNEDGSTIGTTQVEYGTVPSHAEVTKDATAEFTYTFAGWTPAPVAVTGEATYTASFNATKRSYTVNFYDEAGTQILDTKTVEYGVVPVAAVTPTKAADAQYTYTFAGWTPEVVAVTGDANYKATFTPNLRSYTITWKNDDGSVIDTTTVAYGTVPTHEDATKAATAQYTYTFAGWTPEVVAVTGEATYTASFNSTVNKYDITFKNGSAVLQVVNVEYGQKPVYSGETPTKASTAAVNYTFNGWTVEEVSGPDSIDVDYYAPDALPTVTGVASYQAHFAESPRSYTITFRNDDGSLLETQTVAYGETPVYGGDAPTKAATAEYTYTFDGWAPAITTVTTDATYIAAYKAEKNKYDITVITKNTDGTTKTDVTAYEYGATPVLGDPATDFVVGTTKYTFTGWDKEVVSVTGAATYTAQYSESTVTNPVYTINFKYADDAAQAESKAYADHTMQVEEGTTPSAPTPANFETATMKYDFAGWDKEIVPATGDATYTATYTETPILASFNINFRYADKVAQVEDGQLADHFQTVTEGDMPEVPTPADFTDGNTTYTFTGWDKEVAPATGDTVYTAVYKADTKFVPDYSELEELVERYNQMLLTGLYNKNDMKAIKELIDEIEDKMANNEFDNQDDIDAYAVDLRVAEDAARLIDKQEPIEDEDEPTKKPTRRTSPSTGDNATMVVMSIVLISAIGVAVLSLKKKRENI